MAFALLLVFEGMLPFLNPRAWRRLVQLMAGQQDGALRLSGFLMMLAGVALLYLVH